MPDTVISKPSNIQEALKYVDEGKWGVPSFQRSFVWNPKDLKLLLDSIFHNYPCGVLLLMPYEKKIAGRPFEGSSAENVSKYLVLDGQQRLTSCYNAFYNRGKETTKGRRYYYLDLNALYDKCSRIGLGDEGYDTSKINLIEDGIIVDRLEKKAPTNLVDGLVPFFMLKNDTVFSNFLEKYLEIAELPAEMKNFMRVHLRTLINPFWSYNFQTLVLSENMDLSAVCRIFETLNNTGIKLDSFDLCVAKYMADVTTFDLKKKLDESISKHPGLRPLFLKDPNKDDDYRNREVVLQTIALYLKRDHKKNALAGSLDGRTVADNWDEAIENLDYTIVILDRYARTRSTMDLVPHSVAIPVIAAALMRCGYGEMKKNQRPSVDGKVVQYFFGTAFGGRYTDGAPGKMGKDCEALSRWISEGTKPDGDSSFGTHIVLDFKEIKKIGKKSSGATSSAMRCVLVSRNPNDFYGQGEVELKTSNLHHIFPLKRYGDVDSILNLTYIEGSSNASIGDRGVRDYTDEIIGQRGESVFRSVLESHLITGQTYEHLRQEDYKGFVEARFEEIAEYMRDGLGLDVETVDARRKQAKSEETE